MSRRSQPATLSLWIAACMSTPAAAMSAPQTGYHWQQGQWFAYPLAFRNLHVAEADVELVTSREAMARTLDRHPERAGYAEGGRCDADAVTGPEAKMAFAFHLADGRPVARDLFRKPDYETGGAVVSAFLEWAGPAEPSADATRRIDARSAALGPARPLGSGLFDLIYDAPLADDPAEVDHRIFETSGEIVSALRCNVPDAADGGHNVQPLCDGPVWGRAINTVLYLTFPAELAAAPGGWLEPALTALQLANSWRLDE